MQDWKPSDPKALEFDFNECSPQEFCEVFAIPALISQILFEYRLEAQHVFKFDQLMKLKGVDEDTIKQWSNPEPSYDLDARLHQKIGLSPAAAETLPNLLDAIRKAAGASGCVITSRKGQKLLQAGDSNFPLDGLAIETPNFLRPLQEDLLQMKLPTAEYEVVGYDTYELIFLPASGFYVAAAHPLGTLNNQAIWLWNALASEIRKRLPPKVFIDNHAEPLPSDIAFDCPQCVLRILVDQSGAGLTITCPRCKKQLVVPMETTSFSSYYLPKGSQPSASA
jgi:hypothetical protein